MVDLIAKTPLNGLAAMEVGPLRLWEVVPKSILSVSVFKGRAQAASAALQNATGAGLPGPNQRIGSVQWVGPGQYLVIDKPITGLEIHAAVTDQTDAWAILAVQGDDVEDILARLVPIDLRPAGFGSHGTARTLIGHLPASVSRIRPNRFDLMVMRSMGQTLLHEVQKAAMVFATRK